MVSSQLMQEITYVYTRTETPISWRSTEEVFYSNTVQHWQYGIHTWLAGLWMLFSRRVETAHAEMRCSVLVVAVVTISMSFWQYHYFWRPCFALFSPGPFDVITIVDIAVILSVITTVAVTLLIQRFCRRRSVLDMFLTIIIPVWFNRNAIIVFSFVIQSPR